MSGSKTLGLLQEREELIGGLYGLYAGVFPEYKDFWRKTSLEERGHARLLENLRKKMILGLVDFDENRFDPKAVKLSLRFIKAKIREAKSKKVSSLGALAVARELEQGAIETYFYKVAGGDSPELKRTLEKISEGTREHRDRIEKLWTEEKER